MLLMKAGDWVRSTLGIWQLRVAPNLLHGASLELLEDASAGLKGIDLCDTPKAAWSSTRNVTSLCCVKCAIPAS